MSRFGAGSILFIISAGGIHLLVFLCVGVLFVLGGFPPQDSAPWNGPLSDVLSPWVLILSFPVFTLIFWDVPKQHMSFLLLLFFLLMNSLVWGCAIWGIRKTFRCWGRRTRQNVAFAIQWAFFHALCVSLCLYFLGQSQRGLAGERISFLPDLESMVNVLLFPVILLKKGWRDLLLGHPAWIIPNSLLWGCCLLVIMLGAKWGWGMMKPKRNEQININ